MLVRNYRDIEPSDVEEGAKNTTIRWVITEEDGAPHFSMRVFEIGPDGYTPLHEHLWEHEVFVLEGEGVLVSEEGDRPLNPGDVVFVPGNARHQFRSTGTSPLTVLCMIPTQRVCTL